MIVRLKCLGIYFLSLSHMFKSPVVSLGNFSSILEGTQKTYQFMTRRDPRRLNIYHVMKLRQCLHVYFSHFDWMDFFYLQKWVSACFEHGFHCISHGLPKKSNNSFNAVLGRLLTKIFYCSRHDIRPPSGHCFWLIYYGIFLIRVWTCMHTCIIHTNW